MAQFKNYLSKLTCVMYLNFIKAINLYVNVVLMKWKRKECITFTNTATSCYTDVSWPAGGSSGII